MGRALNCEETKRIPVKLALNLGASLGKTKRQCLQPSEMGFPAERGMVGLGRAGMEGLGGTNFQRDSDGVFWGAEEGSGQWLCRLLPAPVSGS